MPVSIVGDGHESLRKLYRVRVPISHTTKPTCIKVEHLKPQVGGVPDHAPRDILSYLHTSTPAVIHQKRVSGILPRLGSAEYIPDPTAENVSGIVDPTLGSAYEYDRREKTFSGLQASAKWTRLRI